MARRNLPWIVLLGAVLHGLAIARTSVPAQDGLKFLRVARQFRSQPWADVIRHSDQHPLYPALIALIEPGVAAWIESDPLAWRLAAQIISTLATLATIPPLHGLTRTLFGRRTADLAALLFVLLPGPAAIGHETLGDPLALLAFTMTLRWGEAAIRTRRIAPALASGASAGLGYWTRPEIVVAAGVVLLVAAWSLWSRFRASVRRDRNDPATLQDLRTLRASLGRPLRGPAAIAISFLAIVGAYAAVKGEVSEKLALRIGASVGSPPKIVRKAGHPLPQGLDLQGGSFEPKEESRRQVRLGWLGGIRSVLHAWSEGMLGGVFSVLAAWGAWRVRARGPGRWLVGVYVVVFGLILARHVVLLQYLSGRHALTLVVATLPWAAAGTRRAWLALAAWRGWEPHAARRRRAVMIGLLFVVCVLLQWKPAHASRAGHVAAARWLTEHAQHGDAILDTRGWTAFLSGLRAYDPWHLPQALTDSRLAFVVIGADELQVESRRSRTLRAILDHAAKPVARFGPGPGQRGDEVLVYRFQPPGSWEGLRP